jgi:hypothetical protein
MEKTPLDMESRSYDNLLIYNGYCCDNRLLRNGPLKKIGNFWSSIFSIGNFPPGDLQSQCNVSFWTRRHGRSLNLALFRTSSIIVRCKSSRLSNGRCTYTNSLMQSHLSHVLLFGDSPISNCRISPLWYESWLHPKCYLCCYFILKKLNHYRYKHPLPSRIWHFVTMQTIEIMCTITIYYTIGTNGRKVPAQVIFRRARFH